MKQEQYQQSSQRQLDNPQHIGSVAKSNNKSKLNRLINNNMMNDTFANWRRSKKHNPTLNNNNPLSSSLVTHNDPPPVPVTSNHSLPKPSRNENLLEAMGAVQDQPLQLPKNDPNSLNNHKSSFRGMTLEQYFRARSSTEGQHDPVSSPILSFVKNSKPLLNLLQFNSGEHLISKNDESNNPDQEIQEYLHETFQINETDEDNYSESQHSVKTPEFNQQKNYVANRNGNNGSSLNKHFANQNQPSQSESHQNSFIINSALPSPHSSAQIINSAVITKKYSQPPIAVPKKGPRKASNKLRTQGCLDDEYEESNISQANAANNNSHIDYSFERECLNQGEQSAYPLIMNTTGAQFNAARMTKLRFPTMNSEDQDDMRKVRVTSIPGNSTSLKKSENRSTLTDFYKFEGDFKKCKVLEKVKHEKDRINDLRMNEMGFVTKYANKFNINEATCKQIIKDCKS